LIAAAFGTFGGTTAAADALFATLLVPAVAMLRVTSSARREATPAMSNTRDLTWLTFLSLELGLEKALGRGGFGRA
jgi:hypothetical protein